MRRRMTVLNLMAIALLGVLIGSCTESVIIETSPPGIFRYVGYDTAGTVIVVGHLAMVFEDSSHVTGDWEFFPVGSPGQIGPQIGKGILRGAFSDGQLRVNLNPGMIDNNVLLAGRFQAEAYSGIWSYSGFPGVIAHGTFVAVR